MVCYRRNRMIALGHATVGSNDLQKAKAFYDALLESAEIAPLFEHPSGGRVYGKDGSPFFVVLGPYDKRPATVGNGSMSAFRFDTRGEVDAFHTKALALGGADEGAPGERAPKFYMSYFRDLDGNKLCAFNLG
jgi:catechol 2,3-dioxygenase-like lactoylglutathione lyase family enzyme